MIVNLTTLSIPEYTKEYETGTVESLRDRAKMLGKQAQLLKTLAQDHNIPVVVTNQITTHFDGVEFQEDEDEEEKDKVIEEDAGGYVTVALGNSWSHYINTRISLEFEATSDAVTRTSQTRILKLVKSPIARPVKMKYEVLISGPVVVSEPEMDDGDGQTRLNVRTTTVS